MLTGSALKNILHPPVHRGAQTRQEAVNGLIAKWPAHSVSSLQGEIEGGR